MAIGVGDGEVVSLSVGVNGGCVVEEGVRGNVAIGVGDREAVSLSVGVAGGGVVEDGVGDSLALGKGSVLW